MSITRLSKRLFCCTANTTTSLPIRSNKTIIIAAAWSTAIRVPLSKRTFGTSIQSAEYRKNVTSDFTRKPEAKEKSRGPLTDMEYDSLASETLEDLTVCFDDIGEEIPMEDFDVEYASGVLTVKLGSKGTYVLNKQPPNKQIWLSSPVSGPERFDYDMSKKAWFCRHTNETLGTLLSREMTAAFEGEFIMPIK